MKQLLKKLFLLLNLIALALPLSAEELKGYVAGTEFEPTSGATHPFYLKEYGNTSTSNSSLAFSNANIFQQDIVVYDNKQKGLAHVGDYGYNHSEFGYKAANSTTVPLNKYIVAKPSQVNKVGGLYVRKNDSYSNNGMFITKTQTGETTCVLYYTIKNLKPDEAYQIKIGFVNLANKTSVDGSLAVKLRYKIHGIRIDGSIGSQLKEDEWNLNTDVGIKNLETQSSQIIEKNEMKDYTGLILTILNVGSEANHVFGLDYINVYSNIELEPTDTPQSIKYDECAKTPSVDKQLSDQIILPQGYTGKLIIYEDVALTKSVKNFNTGIPTKDENGNFGPKTYYYTYQEEGKLVSKTGNFTVWVKPNPTITLSSDIENNAITECNADTIDVKASATVVGSTISNLVWSLKEGATDGVSIGATDGNGKATVSFKKDGEFIFGQASAIFTATAANGCSTSNNANPVKLTNRNCSDLKLTATSNEKVCEGNEITYTFTLKNELEYDSEDIDVSLVLPESGFTVTSTAPSIDGNKWKVSKLEKGDYTTFTVKGTAQVTDDKDSEDVTLTAYVSRVGKSTYALGDINGATVSPKVIVYNTPSTPSFEMEDQIVVLNGKSTISKCNDDTFEVTAKTPAIGGGAWTITPDQDEKLTKDVKIDLKDPAVPTVAIVSGVPLGKSVFIRWTVTNGDCKDENNFVDIELKNDDCTKIDIDSDPSQTKVCESSEVTYTFTLTNKTGVDSENIEVKFELPNELTLLKENAITYTAGEYKDGTWTVKEFPYVENQKTEDKPTLTIKGTVNLSDETIESKNVEVTGTIVKVANQTLDPKPSTKSGVTVYNTPSEPKLEMNELTSVAQCNDGEFDIKAAAPAIGNGEWTIAPKQDEELVKDVQISHLDPNKPNEAKVTGVPLGKKVKVRWTVTNGVCDDADNFAELELTNNNCTTFEPSVDDAEVATCYGTDATFTFTVKNTATVAVKNVKLSLSLESGLALKDASVGDIQFDENNQCVIPKMDSYETVTITVVATATEKNAKATISVLESSGVSVNGVSVSKPVTVYDLPEVSFAKPSSTICIDDLDKEKTKVRVNFTKGKPNFTISYTIGKKSFPDVSATGKIYDIEEFIAANSKISIDKVVDANGCVNTNFGKIEHNVETKKHATLAQLGELDETCEGDTLSLSAPAVTDNGSTVSNQKWILNDKDFSAATLLDFDAHNGQSIYYQVTSSCNGKVRDIKTESVTVSVINSDVSFELAIEGDNVLIAGEKAKVTVEPNEKEAETYRWVANGKELSVSGIEFYDYLYLDTKFEVKAIGSCGTATNTTDIEVIWPTAFTPHNQNGLNDTFAKGMKIMVFNRFYTKIFEGNDGWDGTINGSLNDKTDIAVPGVYYYSVLFPNGVVRKGTIEIIKVD